MVTLTQIRASNAQIDASSFPHVAVFVGGTAGIGKLTLEALANVGLPFKAYVTGRKESKESFQAFTESLHVKNPNADIIWVEGEISLLSEAKRISTYITSLEKSIDLLFMTPGYAPFGGRENTPEGIDTCHSLILYTRLVFTHNLLPSLLSSPHPRIISVHSGTLESHSALSTTDLNLEKPRAFNGYTSQRHMGIMNSLTLERIAEMPGNEGLTVMHTHPGIVRTGNLYRGWGEGAFWGPWVAWAIVDPILRVVAFSKDECKERCLYMCTSGVFGGPGPRVEGVTARTTRGIEVGVEGGKGGMFLVDRKCEGVMNEVEMKKLRENAGNVVWETVSCIIAPYI